jgi:ABC-2 type transport system ATP-binding protein
MATGIEVQSLSKVFDPNLPPALDDISISIKPGKITGIVGPDGAGKTTLIRLMAALLKPSKGTIQINGFDTQTAAEDIHERIGYMPQKFGLYEDLSVIENMQLYADLRGIEAKDQQDIFKRFLHFTRLDPFQKRLAGNLSGGMKQKLGLACALLKDPEVLLLDEPSIGVDPISRRELWAIVEDLVDEGTTVVWSTSYLDEAEQCAEIIALNEGKMIYNGVPQKIKDRVEGRVYRSIKLPSSNRKVLQDIIKNKHVVDVIIQGAGLRVVLEKGVAIEDVSPSPAQWRDAKPDVEEGFMDLLGGVRERTSKIAELLQGFPLEKKVVIEAKNLKKKFGDFVAVDDVSLTIEQGEIFGFLGPNGAGKSTTFKMLCGLLTATEGSSAVLGYDMRHASATARQKIGYMAQKFSLYGNLTVKQNLSFFSRVYGLSGSKQKEAIGEMIDTFGLENYLKMSSESLPLGIKQRLALACSLMHRPEILFLDEPTSGVDPITRREFWLHINGMVRKGVTIMVTTHFIDEAEYCDRLCLINQGKIIAQGTPDDLKNKAKTQERENPTLEQAFIHLIEASEA